MGQLILDDEIDYESAKDILSSYSFANYPHEMQDFLVDFRKAMEE